jgi:hypothetical protein
MHVIIELNQLIRAALAARGTDGHAWPPPGPPMRARPQQTGQSHRSDPLLNALIGAGTPARALAAVERV